MSLTSEVKACAHHLGFQLVGITSPQPPIHMDVYERWLGAGRHGTMEYLATERARQLRAAPALILPDCRSILVVGMRYPPTDLQSISLGKSQQNNGHIAAYACAKDYHKFIPEKLNLLVGFIEEQVGHPVQHRLYTDTGPLLEREMAQRAGLGWIGKNTCLINPSYGSYFLLAEILLGVELEPDLAWDNDRCGTCSRCIQACPTGCILPDRTLDARRCISYLTIELKGRIPVELRPFLGKWSFGCDLCQQVCPWNQRFASLEGDFILQQRSEFLSLDLTKEIHLTPQAFHSKFDDTPVKRAKRRGYLRNIAVNLGNTGDLGVVPDLVDCLGGDPEPLVRGHAAWALGRLGGGLAYQALNTADQAEMDAYVLSEIHSVLDRIKTQ